jgi:hypothetical protein
MDQPAAPEARNSSLNYQTGCLIVVDTFRTPSDQAMAMHLCEQLSNRWDHVQTFLFPHLRDQVGPMTPRHQRVAFVFDFAAFEACIKTFEGLPGRPLKDRFALARAFVAKAVQTPLTNQNERKIINPDLRRQTKSVRLQIGTLSGFRSEKVSGVVGIRSKN